MEIEAEKLLAKIQDNLTKAVDDSIAKNLKPIMEAAAKDEAFKQIKNVVQQLRVQKYLTGMDKSGLSDEQKKSFAQKVLDVFYGKAQTVASPEKGGVLIPDEVYPGIMRVAQDFGFVMAGAMKVPMTGTSQVTMPKYTGAASDQEWEYLGENGEATETDVSIANAVLNLKLANRIVRLDNRLLQQATVALADWLIAIFAESLAYTIDKQAFVGVGRPFQGILNNSDITVVTMTTGATSFANVAMSYFTQMIAAVRMGARSGSAFFINTNVYGYLADLKDSQGQYIFKQDNNMASFGGYDMPQKPIGSIKGYPVYGLDVLPGTADDAVSTKFCVFGNLKFLLLGENGSMTIAKSDSATVGGKNVFATVQTAIRVTHEHAIAVGNEKAFSIIKTAAS